MAKLNIKKGDTVVVIAGKDNGKVAEVLDCFPAENKVTVKVNAKSNKDEIKYAFEAIFGVKVAKVNVINVRPRAKRLGRFEGQVSGYKKAIIKLAEGQSLDLYSEASE